MIREVDLLSYLPLFMQEYKEIQATLEAENPEFVLIWTAADETLKNEFIETADEYGISRFESLLGILPYDDDTLESRRARVSARWFNNIPYTMKVFLEKLKTICGDTDFTLTHDFETGYTLTIITDLETFGLVEELEEVLNTWLPANINCISLNQIPCNSSGNALFGGGIVFCNKFLITNDFNETDTISGNALTTGGTVFASKHLITNDFEEDYQADSDAYIGGGVVNTATVIITNDFNESFSISGDALTTGGTVIAETIEINTDD